MFWRCGGAELRVENYIPIPLCNTQPQIMQSVAHIRGWTTVPYLPQDLEDTLFVWGEYLDAVMPRMPTTSALEEAHSTHVFRALLDANDVRRGFNREFLLRARTPPGPLAFIAPGLEAPTAESLSQCLVHIDNFRTRGGIDPQDQDADYRKRVPAVVLFPLLNNSGVEAPLQGLLLAPDENRAWEDIVAVSLPRHEPDSNTDWFCPFTTRMENVLFQPAKCPFGYDRCVTVAALLSKWKELIEQGV